MPINSWDQQHGWNETKMAADGAIVAALADHKIVCRRIRGTLSGSTLTATLQSKPAGAGVDIDNAPVLADGDHDIPGLAVETKVGEGLTLDDMLGGTMWFQWAYVPVRTQSSWEN